MFLQEGKPRSAIDQPILMSRKTGYVFTFKEETLGEVPWGGLVATVVVNDLLPVLRFLSVNVNAIIAREIVKLASGLLANDSPSRPRPRVWMDPCLVQPLLERVSEHKDIVPGKGAHVGDNILMLARRLPPLLYQMVGQASE